MWLLSVFKISSVKSLVLMFISDITLSVALFISLFIFVTAYLLHISVIIGSTKWLKHSAAIIIQSITNITKKTNFLLIKSPSLLRLF